VTAAAMATAATCMAAATESTAGSAAESAAACYGCTTSGHSTGITTGSACITTSRATVG
jgi:hypothetical protein